MHLITSDQYTGLVNAIREHFQSATWQRFQTHFSKNVLDRTPKYLQLAFMEDIRRLYEAIDLDSARKTLDEIISGLFGTTSSQSSLDTIDSLVSVPCRYFVRMKYLSILSHLLRLF